MSAAPLLGNLLKDVFTRTRRGGKAVANKVIRGLVRDIVEERMRTIVIITSIHIVTTYIGLRVFGEFELLDTATRFVYFYVITGSTVGYGDFSPSTPAGQIFVAFWVIPGAISIFAFIITKLISSLITFVRKIMSGLGNFENTTGHMVIIGYIGGETERLIEETNAVQGQAETVIVTLRDSLPLPAKITRIRTMSLSNTPDLVRAGIKGAKAIVIMAETDDETMAAALAISALGTKAHVVAYFRDDAKADLVRPHCTGFEFVVSTSVQHVSRAIVDPGASQVLVHLSSSAIGATLNSMDYQGVTTSAMQLRDALADHGATLIGYRLDQGSEPTLSFDADTQLGPEHTLFYISEQRLPDGLQLAV